MVAMSYTQEKASMEQLQAKFRYLCENVKTLEVLQKYLFKLTFHNNYIKV